MLKSILKTTIKIIISGTLIVSSAAIAQYTLTRVSAYNLTKGQTDSTPNVGACGRMKPNTIAVSRNLFYNKYGRVRCGQRVKLINRNGVVLYKTIWDTMNPRYYNAADILMSSYSQAIQFGRQSGWTLYFL